MRKQQKKYGLTGSKTVTEEPAVVEKTIDIPPKESKQKKPKAKQSLRQRINLLKDQQVPKSKYGYGRTGGGRSRTTTTRRRTGRRTNTRRRRR